MNIKEDGFGYAIVDPDGNILFNTIRPTLICCQENFINDINFELSTTTIRITWNDLKSKGYTSCKIVNEVIFT